MPPGSWDSGDMYEDLVSVAFHRDHENWVFLWCWNVLIDWLIDKWLCYGSSKPRIMGFIASWMTQFLEKTEKLLRYELNFFAFCSSSSSSKCTQRPQMITQRNKSRNEMRPIRQEFWHLLANENAPKEARSDLPSSSFVEMNLHFQTTKETRREKIGFGARRGRWLEKW